MSIALAGVGLAGIALIGLSPRPAHAASAPSCVRITSSSIAVNAGPLHIPGSVTLHNSCGSGVRADVDVSDGWDTACTTIPARSSIRQTFVAYPTQIARARAVKAC